MKTHIQCMMLLAALTVLYQQHAHKQAIFDQGRDAAFAGVAHDSNPYPMTLISASDWYAWQKGWMQGMKEKPRPKKQERRDGAG